MSGKVQEFVLRHDYAILFLGSWFFFLFGGMVLLLALLPADMPNRPMVVVFGLGLAGVGALLRWIGTTWAESFVLDDEAITWHRGGEVRLRLSLHEVRRVRFVEGSLVIEGER